MRITAGRAVGVLVAVFALAQVVAPARTNPAGDPAMAFKAMRPAGDPAVAIMERSCRDCHTNDTVWPAYTRIAPISWLAVHDVTEGRAELNLSEFGTYDAAKQQHKLEEVCDAVSSGEMPMWIHTLAHPEAALRPGEVDTLCALSRPAGQE